EPDETPPPKKSEPPPAPPSEEKLEPVPERPVVELIERRRPPPPGPPKRPGQTWTAEDEDSSPYTVSGGPDRKCPQCSGVLAPEAVLCVRCGLDLKSGKTLVREYKPIARSWEPVSFETRLKLFCLAAFGGLGLSLLMGALLDALTFSFAPWLV